MATRKNQGKKAEPFINIDDESLKDLKLCAAAFVAMVTIIFHYAWIMRQWVINPLLSRTTLVIYFLSLVCTVIIVFGVLGKVVHPRIYGTGIALEKKNE